MAGESAEDQSDTVDKQTAAWRQGDCVLGDDCWFAYRAADGQVEERRVRGFIVVSQTCDVVRACLTRPYVDVCPLVEIPEEQMPLVRTMRTPQFAYVPALADKLLVADLDRTMSMEKAALVKSERLPGCPTDHDIRAFADCLQRKSSRFAFPDDFVGLCGKFQDRVQAKHGRQSDEGRALEALREIRVEALPFWDAEKVELTFFFIKKDEPKFEKETWPSLLKKWLALLPAQGKYWSVEGQITTLADMTAEEYVGSDLLDLDRLSAPPGK